MKHPTYSSKILWSSILAIAMVLLPFSGFVPTAFVRQVHGAESIASKGYENTIKTARTTVQNQLDIGAASSATVAVSVEGKIVYSEGFGLRDRANGLAVNADTQFNIASVSKVFTGAAMLTLVQQGKVDLDSPVTKYIPEFTMADERYKDITVRMLLNHTSGMPGMNVKESYTSEANNDMIQQTLDYLKTSTLKHNPGEISVYCNDGFTVAEAVIERVSGMSYARFIEKEITSKLDMNHTTVNFKEGYDNYALYYGGGSTVAHPLEYSNTKASGGLTSTAEDLCKFAAITQPDVIFDDAQLEEFLKPQYGPKTVLSGEPVTNYGLGWDSVAMWEFKEQGVTALAKNGGSIQFASQLDVVPDHKIAVAVIYCGAGDSTGTAAKILQALLEEKGIISKQEIPSAPKAADLPDSYQKYEGYYASEDFIFKVTPDPAKKGLFISMFSNGEFTGTALYPYQSDDTFPLPNGDALRFEENAAGKYISIIKGNAKYSAVNSEMLKPVTGIDNSRFKNKTWVPKNFSPTDLVPFILKTDTIEGLDGYIIANPYRSNVFIPVALKSEVETKMNFQYIRDQSAYKLVKKNGTTTLMLNRYAFTDGAKVRALWDNETIVIGTRGENAVRILDKAGVLKLSIPKGVRVLVFGKDLDKIHDSLVNGEEEIFAEKGSYVIAVGKPGDSIQTGISDKFRDMKGHWSEDGVNRLAFLKLVQGNGNGLYEPDVGIKAADFVGLLSRTFGVAIPQASNPELPAQEALGPENASPEGAISDKGSTAKTLTRSQGFALITELMKAMGVENPLTDLDAAEALKGFKDAESLDAKSKKDAAICVQLGIIAGVGEGLLAPDKVLTRAEAAVMLARMIQ